MENKITPAQPPSAPAADLAAPLSSFQAILSDLNGGVFEEQLDRALQDVALGVVLNGSKGRRGDVTIKLTFARIGESSQVSIAHALSYNRPTKRGKATETYVTETPMYVGRGGKLSLVPDEQTRFDFDDARREKLDGR